MHAPLEPGRYVAEIDLVHEGVTWFDHKGLRTVRFGVEVSSGGGTAGTDRPVAIQEYAVPEYPADALPPPSADAPDPEPFDMHAVPHEEVLALIRRHGATLIHLEEDRRAGPEWASYRYFVAKRR